MPRFLELSTCHILTVLGVRIIAVVVVGWQRATRKVLPQVGKEGDGLEAPVCACCLCVDESCAKHEGTTVKKWRRQAQK